MTTRKWATWMIVLDLCLLLGGIGATVVVAHAGAFYVTGSLGAAHFLRTIPDGTWIQEGLPHTTDLTSLAWRTGAGYRLNESWSVQAHYLNFGTAAINTLAVRDEQYNPHAHRCHTACDEARPFHSHDLMEGVEVSISRHWALGPVNPFLRAGGALLYHRLTVQWSDINHPSAQQTMHGWIPTALVGGGVCAGWLCAETTYYRGFGGGEDWSAGLPIAKQSVMTLLSVNVPLSF